MDTHEDLSTYGKRLNYALQVLAKKDRKELATAIGLSVQSIGQVITGVTKALTAENSSKAARFLRVDHHWLATGEGVARPKRPGWPFTAFGSDEYFSLDEAFRMEMEDRIAGAILRKRGVTITS
ncbi:helix-turn-helix transcriptional regulator [uncultured Pseudacidovorax sp.]|uniref:helix-turn-helix domain-containing protein n=1 Tax=uncultured Pseudacidovorax sp. TaxID=679313 RepID=UPI0025E0FE0D|nr:helix-turn-helix transcriptional regulator [uncultured Pseudacidovorax sp.]